jgi:hypothetical protein
MFDACRVSVSVRLREQISRDRFAGNPSPRTGPKFGWRMPTMRAFARQFRTMSA